VKVADKDAAVKKENEKEEEAKAPPVVEQGG